MLYCYFGVCNLIYPVLQAIATCAANFVAPCCRVGTFKPVTPRQTSRPRAGSQGHMDLPVQLGEAFGWWLQPVALVIWRIALDDVERVDDAALLAQVLLALVEQIPVDEDE